MDLATQKDVRTLQVYLHSLPKTLPLPQTSQYDFSTFAPDPEWMADVGEEGAVNRELEIRLGSRASGPVVLRECGETCGCF